MEYYLKGKLIFESAPNESLGVYKVFIKTEYEITDRKAFDDVLVCKVTSTLQYKRSDNGGGATHSSEGFEIAIQNSKDPVLIDWYGNAPYAFESQVRDFHLDLFDPEDWITNADAAALNDRIYERVADAEPSAENLKKLK